jgi:hypothetical protein
MGHKLHKLTTAASAALVLAALLACKKKKAPPPAVSVAASAPAPAPTPSASAAPAPADTVKRYGDKETEAKGTVRVTVANAKVYKEADATTDSVTTLAKGTYVNKKALYGNWLLVDYPSGVGELSPGWILRRMVTVQVVQADPAELKKQQEEAAKKAAEEAAKKAAEAAKTADAGAKATAAANASAQKAIEDAKKAADKAAASASAAVKTGTPPRLGLPHIQLRAPVAPKK